MVIEKYSMKHIPSLLFSLALSTSAMAGTSHGYGIHYIHGEGDVRGVKLAYQYHTNDWLPESWHLVNMYFESSVNFWRFGDSGKYDQNFVLAVSPVIQYPIATVYNKPLSIEFGIGVALLEDTQFAGKNVSTHYQFEDRLGFVYDLGDANIAMRYIHYSNAGFKSPNPGLDFLSLSYSAKF
ncbi:acyloxyacyl hydrolase [Pseudoalteromonas luteoviolacea]|nr:acyloxyacyl hydrolase [Pseudoalteromonas luteoviolacea]